MEKDKRLINLYDINGADSCGIDGIYVDNIVLFDKLGKVVVTMTGSQSLKSDNSLGRYCELFGERYSTRMLPKFLDINEENISDRLPVLSDTVRYLVKDIDASLFGQLSNMRLSWDGGILYITIPSGMFNIYDDGQIARIELDVKKTLEGLTSVDPREVRIVSEEDAETGEYPGFYPDEETEAAGNSEDIREMEPEKDAVPEKSIEVIETVKR